MRLADRNPRWIMSNGRIVGVRWECPHCDITLGVRFRNPPDGGPPKDDDGKPLWDRTGDTFDTLSLSPSVNAVGHWHGWVRNGELVTD